MDEKIVYSPKSTKAMIGGEYERLETWDFARAGTAARVFETSNLCDRSENSSIVHIDDAQQKARPRIVDPGMSVAETDTASIEEIRASHSIPAGESPQASDQPTVAVVDTGLDPTHPIFADISIHRRDMTGDGPGDAHGHGTAVAGQIARIAPEATIISIRVLGSDGSGSYSNLLSAYEWLHQNTDQIDVFNMSLGFPSKVPTIDRIHNELVATGVRDAVAAGNTGDSGGSPATAKRAFSTGACNLDHELASFSSHDQQYDNPDITAVGVNCRMAQADGTQMGTDLNGPYVSASGTSFSAPIAAGTIARYINRGLDPAESIPRAFEKTADDIEETKNEGSGVLDYTGTIDEATTTNAFVYSLLNQDTNSVYLQRNWLPEGSLRAELVDTETEGTTITFIKK